jgi:hypothetical protein
MDLDVLDETYPMVKSKLPLEDYDRGGRTGWSHRVDRPTQSCQFWVSTDSSTGKDYNSEFAYGGSLWGGKYI